MKRICWLVLLITAGLSVSAAQAQYRTPPRPQPAYFKFELVPTAGYMWGGSYPIDAVAGVGGHPAGDLRIDDSFAYGIMLNFFAQRGTALELTYMRQDTDLRFDPVGSVSSQGNSASFASNYIHLGGRQEFGRGGKLRPFIDGSFGATVFDITEPGIGTTTRFSLSIGGGFQALFGEAERFGLRGDIKGWFTFLPSNDYFYWCDFYGCGVSQGSVTVSQGQVTGGIVIKF